MSIAIVIRRARRVEAGFNSSGSARCAGVSVMPRSTEQARQFVLGPAASMIQSRGHSLRAAGGGIGCLAASPGCGLPT
jgi:hypothetical protein